MDNFYYQYGIVIYMKLEIRKNKTKQCGVRLTIEEYGAIEARAKKEGVSCGEIIRAIVNAWYINEK